MIGKEKPGTNLDKKVIGYSLAQKIDVLDPITGHKDSKPIKPFMVSQLQILFERGNLILSEFDEDLYKQLIDYSVVRITQSGLPVFTDKNEHSVDCLGLAYLAFVLHFPQLTNVVKHIENSTKIAHTTKSLGTGGAIAQLWQASNSSLFSNTSRSNKDPFRDEIHGEKQQWVKVTEKSVSSSHWSNRRPSRSGRSMW